MQIIKHRKHVVTVTYFRSFDYEGTVNHGFSFDCNERGVVDVEALRPAGRANYEACLTGQVGSRKVIDQGVDRREHSHYEPAVGRCACGSNVELSSGWANECHCGREYNGAPRSQWGEETGEQF